MPYEEIKRTVTRFRGMAISIPPSGRLGCNAPLGKDVIARGVQAFRVMFDPESGHVAFRPAPRTEDSAFPLIIPAADSPVRLTSISFLCKPLLDHVRWSAPKRVLVPVQWFEQEQLYVGTLPAEYLGAPKKSKKSTGGTDGGR